LVALGAGIYLAEMHHRSPPPVDGLAEDVPPASVKTSVTSRPPANGNASHMPPPATPGARQTTYFSSHGSSHPSTSGGTVPLIPLTNLGEGEARLFRVMITHTGIGGMAASGRFYDEPSGTYHSPLQAGASRSGRPRTGSKGTLTGDIFIRDLAGVVDGQQWAGMLVRDGVATYHIPYHGDHTVPAYRVSIEPPPPPDPKAWMWK
jgi:hypothetical protein